MRKLIFAILLGCTAPGLAAAGSAAGAATSCASCGAGDVITTAAESGLPPAPVTFVYPTERTTRLNAAQGFWLRQLVAGLGELVSDVRFVVTGHGSAPAETAPDDGAAAQRAELLRRELERLGVSGAAIEMHTDLASEDSTPRTEVRVELARKLDR